MPPPNQDYGNTVYIYVTNSLPFKERQNLDLVITQDIESLEVVRNVLDTST